MKRGILGIVLVLLGGGLLSYPHVAAHYFEENASTVMQEYIQAVEESGETLQAEWDRAAAYNSLLGGVGITDPFLAGSGMVLGEDYLALLDMGGVMGHLRIPKIDVELAIRHGTSEETLRGGAGHLEGTALPVGGPGTHCVLTGHTGLVTAKLFTDLGELVEGDLFFLHILDTVLAYAVDQIRVVEPETTADLLPALGEDYVTLLTCTPYGVNSHRLLVRGTRIPYIPELEAEAETQSSGWGVSEETRLLILAAAVSAACMAAVITLVLVIQRKKIKS